MLGIRWRLLHCAGSLSLPSEVAGKSACGAHPVECRNQLADRVTPRNAGQYARAGRVLLQLRGVSATPSKWRSTRSSFYLAQESLKGRGPVLAAIGDVAWLGTIGSDPEEARVIRAEPLPRRHKFDRYAPAANHQIKFAVHHVDATVTYRRQPSTCFAASPPVAARLRNQWRL